MKDVNETFFIWTCVYFLFASSLIALFLYGNIIPEPSSHIISGLLEWSIVFLWVYYLHKSEAYRKKPITYVKYYFFMFALVLFLFGLDILLEPFSLKLASIYNFVEPSELALYVLLGSIIYSILVIIILVRYQKKLKKEGSEGGNGEKLGTELKN